MGWYRRFAAIALPDASHETPWVPHGCDIDCLEIDDPPTVGLSRKLLRFMALGVCGGVTAGLMVVLPKRSRAMGWAIRVGSRLMVGCIGLRTLLADDPPRVRRLGAEDKGLLLVATHLSWVDILLIQGWYGPMRMVAMAEVRSWPVLNWLSGKARTIYINRERLLRLPGTVGRVTEALRSGEVVGAFPEGATSCGRHSLAFRPALFQAAVDANAKVEVVSISYSSGGKTTTHASFLGRETVWPSLWRLLGLARLSATLHRVPLPGDAGTSSRGELAAAAQKAAKITANDAAHG